MPLMSDNRRAFEGDVVELLVDIPNTKLKRGQRGVVITTFDEPTEAYDLEIVDQSGDFTGFAYSVKEDQFTNLSRSAFVRAMEAVEKVDLITAEKELKTATDLRPDYIGGFVKSVLMSFDEGVQSTGIGDHVSFVIPLLRMAVRVDPEYEIARINLAVAFLNFGVAQARKGDLRQALELFYSALSIRTDAETESRIKTNIVIACTALGRELFKANQIEEAFASFRAAFLVIQDDKTRHNLGLAYGNAGLHYMKTRNFDLAIQSFERAEDSGVLHADFVNDYGICLLIKGRIREAQRAFERVLEMDQENEFAKSNLLKIINTPWNVMSQELPNEVEALLNDISASSRDVMDFDGRMPEALSWRKPIVSAREFAPAA
jgi:Tfp pilus assembly protein PilF